MTGADDGDGRDDCGKGTGSRDGPDGLFASLSWHRTTVIGLWAGTIGFRRRMCSNCRAHSPFTVAVVGPG